jgi:hypothetical protein
MDADVTTHGGAVLTFRDVRTEGRTLTATVNGRRVSLPKDRLLAQKILVATERDRRRGVAGR